MRIISLSPSNTEILCALGAVDDVVAITHLCDYPLSVRSKPRIGTWISTEPQRLAQLKPDLVITSYFLPQPLRSWSKPEQLLHLEPKTLTDVYQSILSVGKAIGRKKEAATLVSTMKKQLSDIQKKTKGKKKIKVYMEEWHKPPFVSGNWVPELVTIAGGTLSVPVLALSAGGKEDLIKPGEPSRQIELSELEAFDPDIMMCHWCGAGPRIDVSGVAKRPGWEQLRAVKEGHVYSLNDSLLNRPGPRLVEGAQTLFSILQSLETPAQ